MMRLITLVVFVALVNGYAGLCTRTPHFEVVTRDAAYSHAIVDIDQWSADNFAEEPDADLAYWRIRRFELDINADGHPEVFAWTPVLHGNAGGPYLVFTQNQRKHSFSYIGQIDGGHPELIRVLPSIRRGKPRVLTGRREGNSIRADVWQNDGGRFIAVSSEVLPDAARAGSKRFDELFGKTEKSNKSTGGDVQ